MPLGLDHRRAERGGLDLDAGVAREDDVAAGVQEVVVDREARGVEAEAGSKVAITRGDADDSADNSESVRGNAGLGSEVAIFIKGPAGEHREQQGSDDAGLIARGDGAFGVEREVLRFFGCSTGERAFYFAVVALRKLDLLEGEAEFSVTAKGAGCLGHCHLADEFGSLGNDELLVFVINRLDDEGFDRIAGLGCC